MAINPWDSTGLDEDLGEAMDTVFSLLHMHPSNKDTDDQLRLRIVSHNLRALASVVLIADEDEETFALNLKQLALGLLGTSDWIQNNLPDLPEEDAG